jgi:general secretion pathway protein D
LRGRRGDLVLGLKGEFLRQGGAQTAFTSRIDPNGQILLTGTRSGETGATALGAIATINFRVAAAVPGESQIQLLTIAPIGLGGRSIFAPVPPPHLIQIGAN